MMCVVRRFDGAGTLEFRHGGKYVATWKLGKLVSVCISGCRDVSCYPCN
jgi:hypothetical protein